MPTHARTHARAGRHEIVIDEPTMRGGTDWAPTPLETLLAALVGCTNVILHQIAMRDRVVIDALEVKAEAMFDRRGVMLQEEVAVPFPSIGLNIAFSTDAGPGKIDRLKPDLGRFCPVLKILHQSGTHIEETWVVTCR